MEYIDRALPEMVSKARRSAVREDGIFALGKKNVRRRSIKMPPPLMATGRKKTQKPIKCLITMQQPSLSLFRSFYSGVVFVIK
jgi:hypothetical protein